MNSPSSPPWLYYFAVATAFLTWFLIIVGGIVHGTGSSLACPDWPTCYGSFFPEMTGGIFFEHSHRIVAAAVGLLTIFLCLFLFRGSDRKNKILGILAVLLVIFQGVLGGITVIYRLPTAISTAHLATSMLFLGLLVWIAYRLYTVETPRWGVSHSGGPEENRIQQPMPPRETPHRGVSTVGWWILLTIILVYIQIVWGGLVRHTGAGLACLDIPLCRGTLWPLGGPPILQAHMLHRILAILVTILILVTSYKILRSSPSHSWLRFLAWLAPALIAIQITLGLLSIQSLLALFPVTAHLAVGALLWVVLVLMCLQESSS